MLGQKVLSGRLTGKSASCHPAKLPRTPRYCCHTSSSSSDRSRAAAAAAARSQLQLCRSGSATVSSSPSSSTESSSSSTAIDLRRSLLMQQLLDEQSPGTVDVQPDRSHDAGSSSSSSSSSSGGSRREVPAGDQQHSNRGSSSSSSSRQSQTRGSTSKRSKGFATAAAASSNGSSSSTAGAQQQRQQEVSANAACPCCSGLKFKDCCQPFLAGTATPRSALELVSARVTATKTGNVSYLVSTTHPDSIMALGGARDMASKYKRRCAGFRANQMEVVGMAHCPGDLPGTWVVLTIFKATTGDLALQKAPYMELIVRRDWSESAAAAAAAAAKSGLWGGAAGSSSSSSEFKGDWMYLRVTNEFPQNGQAEVLVQLLQRHCPELLIQDGQQQQQQQRDMAEREVCFAWTTPNLHVGQASSSSGSSSRWYVDLLSSAAEPLGRRGRRQQQQQQPAAANASNQTGSAVYPGCFSMDEYLERRAQEIKAQQQT